MLQALNQAIQDYQMKWQALIASCTNREFFEDQQPTAVGWKVQDLQELDQKLKQLRDHCDQIHCAWVDGRWLVTLHLKDTKLAWDIAIIKLMQRRPSATDAGGFDHIDFYSLKNDSPEAILRAEPDLKWSHKQNAHCSYYSLWFAETEAKLRADTVLHPCIAELQEAQEAVLKA